MRSSSIAPEDRSDETRGLSHPVKPEHLAEHLAEVGAECRADQADQHGDDAASWIFPRHEQFGDDAHEEADDDCGDDTQMSVGSRHLRHAVVCKSPVARGGLGGKVAPVIPRLLLLILTALLAACAQRDTAHTLRVSVPDQKLALFRHGVEVARYDVSTGKNGVGDRPGSHCTPLGTMEIAQKIGGGQPAGMKFKSRRPTGEIVRPNSPGRDPIVSRILWLRGRESGNRNAEPLR